MHRHNNFAAVIFAITIASACCANTTTFTFEKGDQGFQFVAATNVNANASLSSVLAAHTGSERGVNIVIHDPPPVRIQDTQLWSPPVTVEKGDNTFLFWAYSFPMGVLNAVVIDSQNKTVASQNVSLVADWSQQSVNFSAASDGQYRLLLQGLAYGYSIPRGTYATLNFDDIELVEGKVSAASYKPPPSTPNPGRGGGPQGREALQKALKTGQNPVLPLTQVEPDNSNSQSSNMYSNGGGNGAANNRASSSGSTNVITQPTLTVMPSTSGTVGSVQSSAAVSGGDASATLVNMQYTDPSSQSAPQGGSTGGQTLYQTRSTTQPGAVIIPLIINTPNSQNTPTTQPTPPPAVPAVPAPAPETPSTPREQPLITPPNAQTPPATPPTEPVPATQPAIISSVPTPTVSLNMPAAVPLAAPQGPPEGVLMGNSTTIFTFDMAGVSDVSDAGTTMRVWKNDANTVASWNAPDATAAHNSTGGLLVNITQASAEAFNYDVQVKSPDFWMEANQTYYMAFHARASSDVLVNLDLLLREGFVFKTGVELKITPTWQQFNLSGVAPAQSGVYFYGINLGLSQAVFYFDTFNFGPLGPAAENVTAPGVPAPAPVAPAPAPVVVPAAALVAPPVGQPQAVAISVQVQPQGVQGLGVSQDPVVANVVPMTLVPAGGRR